MIGAKCFHTNCVLFITTPPFRFVLTAAHCFESKAPDAVIEVVLGRYLSIYIENIIALSLLLLKGNTTSSFKKALKLGERQ